LARIHQISHDKNLTEKKVNYFLDYFYFFVDQIGKYDGFDLENYLSLSEKILYQANYNSKRPHDYIDKYFLHSLFNDKNKYLNDYSKHKEILSLKKTLISLKKSEKREFVQSKEFKDALTKFKRQIKSQLFKKSLKEIISYLKCTHDLDFHLEDLIYHTKILATSLLIHKTSKEDVLAVTKRIFSKELYEFPFPKNITSKNRAAKTRYLKNSNFDKQFQAIHNVLTEKFDAHWFLFKIDGFNSEPGFIFKYNNVSFINPNNKKFVGIKKNLKQKRFASDYFEGENFLIAVVKVSHNSAQEANNAAAKIVASELDYFNDVLGAYGVLDKQSYLATTDFVNAGGRVRMSKSRSYKVRNYDIDLLSDNPYKFLSKKSLIKKHFLKYEPYFSKAMRSGNISEYWQYLENLLSENHDDKDNNQIVRIVSTILLLNAESTQKRFLLSYIRNSISPHGINAERLGITAERQSELYRNSYPTNEGDVMELKKEIKHDFLNYLFSELEIKYDKEKYNDVKKFYEQILWDAQAQRNSYIHSGTIEPNSEVSLKFLLPRLIMKFRWMIFANLEHHKSLTFQNYISQLEKEGSLLLT